MNSQNDIRPQGRSVPELVPAILKQVARLRSRGVLAQDQFEAQIARLSAEELRPRGFSLLIRELAGGQTRFLVKGRDGSVCEMIDCPAPSADQSALSAQAA